MMPVAENNIQNSDNVDYKKKYKVLKRKLRFLLYEHECFLEELRKSQRKLLKISRDKTFLLDRLLQYEKIDDSSSDSDATASSDSETEAGNDGPTAPKRKKQQPSLNLPNFADPSVLLGTTGLSGAMPQQSSLLCQNVLGPFPMGLTGMPALFLGSPAEGTSIHTSSALHKLSCLTAQASSKAAEPVKKRPKVSKKSKPVTLAATLLSQNSSQSAGTSQSEPKFPVQMTREELERHLEFKQSTKPQFMSIEKAPHYLPDDIFSNENSNPDSEMDIKEELDDSDLVIDVPKD